MPVAATVAFSRRQDGNFHIAGDAADLSAQRERFAPGAWTWLRQVHGSDVVVVDEPGAHAGAIADGAVTAVPDAVLAVHTADCVPVLLRSLDGSVVGVAHAGWRGLLAGVLEATVDAMTALGATGIQAVVGPHIRARCYEFGPSDLAAMTRRFGSHVVARTALRTPALDLLACVHGAVEPLGVTVTDEGGCTACEPVAYYSHRARADAGRHAAVAVIREVAG